MKLELIVQNTNEEIYDHKLEREVGYYRCLKCGHKWKATIGEMMDNPECRKCGC